MRFKGLNLKRTVVAILVLLLVGFSSFYYFSDDEWVGAELSIDEENLKIYTYALADSNSVDTGTVNITVGDMIVWNGTTSLSYMLPGYGTGYIEISVHNNGTETARVYKMVNVTDWGTGIYNEPEQVAEEEIGGPVDDLHNVTDYSLNYNVYDGSNELIRSGIEFVQGDSMTVGKINGGWIDLGELRPGHRMEIRQGYHLLSDTKNEYQGDKFAFDIKFLAEPVGS